MKKFLRNGLMLAAAGTLLFTACDPEETVPENPTISVTTDPADGIVEVNEAISFTANVTAPAGFNTVRLTGVTSEDANITIPSGYQTEYTRNDLGLTAEDTEATAEFGGLSLPVGGEFTFTFLAVDEEGGSVEEDVIITVNDKAATIYTAKLLYAPTVNQESKTFFSTNLGQTVSKNEVDASAAPNSSDIDFGYAAGSSGTLWLASPSSYPSFTEYDLSIWNTLNTTTFVDVALSDEEYMALSTNSDLENAFNNGATPEDRKSGFASGDIFAFQLDEAKNGKYGVVKVTAVVDGNEDGDFIDSTDYIEIEILVQAD
jgi:hypothetical protein